VIRRKGNKWRRLIGLPAFASTLHPLPRSRSSPKSRTRSPPLILCSEASLGTWHTTSRIGVTPSAVRQRGPMRSSSNLRRRLALLLTGLLLAVSTDALAQTGDVVIVSNTTWAAGQIQVNSLTVKNGATLTVGGGSTRRRGDECHGDRQFEYCPRGCEHHRAGWRQLAGRRRHYQRRLHRSGFRQHDQRGWARLRGRRRAGRRDCQLPVPGGRTVDSAESATRTLRKAPPTVR